MLLATVTNSPKAGRHIRSHRRRRRKFERSERSRETNEEDEEDSVVDVGLAASELSFSELSHINQEEANFMDLLPTLTDCPLRDAEGTKWIRKRLFITCALVAALIAALTGKCIRG